MPIQNITLEKIRPNPYQPASRLEIQPDVAEFYGRSILEHGMISTPVGRRTNGFFEMGDGWLRYNGYKWLVDNGHVDFQQIPVDIRELTDQQMADLVLEANKTRKDLTDIDQALFYQRYIEDFGVSQSELARRFNKSQGEVANTIRLLGLPENVKEKVISREISGTHARQLLRLNDQPKVQEEFLEETVKQGASVSQLDVSINRHLWDASMPLTKDGYPEPVFNTKECEGCEHRQELADPYGRTKKKPRCLNKECWQKKQAKAEKARDAKAKAKVMKKAAGAKVLTDRDISYGNYEFLDHYGTKYQDILDSPEECEKCEKRSLFLMSYRAERNEDPEPICTDPKCFRSKKTRRTKAENKVKREKDKALTLKLGEICEKHNKNRSAALVLALRKEIGYMGSAECADLMAMYPGLLPSHSNGRLDRDVFKSQCIDYDEPTIVQLLNAVIITNMRRSSYDAIVPTLKGDAKKALSLIEGTWETAKADNIAFQEANCRGCERAKESMVSTGEDCCEWNHYREIEKGFCKNGPRFEELTGKKKKKPKGDDLPKFEPEEPWEPPEGVRRAQDVPDEECEGCNLATEDHTLGHMFKVGNVSHKVCIKDFRAQEAKEEVAEPVS